MEEVYAPPRRSIGQTIGAVVVALIPVTVEIGIAVLFWGASQLAQYCDCSRPSAPPGPNDAFLAATGNAVLGFVLFFPGICLGLWLCRRAYRAWAAFGTLVFPAACAWLYVGGRLASLEAMAPTVGGLVAGALLAALAAWRLFARRPLV